MVKAVAEYQERQVNEHALRVRRSQERWAVIISTTSYGRRRVDSCVSSGSSGALPRRRLIMALPPSQVVTTRVEIFCPRGANGVGVRVVCVQCHQ